MRSMRKAVNIPKETKGKMRPLGISCYEDKLVENAIAQILEQIYEPKFYDESFGFRPNRSCHQAVREIIEMVQYRKTNYVVEAENVISYDTEMTLYAVSRTNMRRKYSNKGWKNALGSMGWNWQRKRGGEGKPNTFDFHKSDERVDQEEQDKVAGMAV